MELTARKEDLSKGLAKSQTVVEKRTSMAILSNVLLEAQEDRLIISATDLETSFIGEYQARVSRPGKITIPARKLYEIVRELPSDEVYLKEKENSHVHLTGGRANYDLVGLPADDFPAMPEIEDMPSLKFEGEILSEMIAKTIFSISQEDTRFNLAGLYVEKRIKDEVPSLRFVSTDGHRLSLIDRTVEGLGDFPLSKGVIIPRKGVNELLKLAEEGGPLELALNQKFAVVTKEEVKLILRLQEGNFPDYEVVVPKVPKRKATVNRRAFSDVLKRMAIMATDRFQGVRLDFKTGLLEVVSQSAELGEAREALEIDYDNQEFNVGFNVRYFQELCGAMKSEEISLGFVDEQNPCLIKGEGDEGYISVIMPMRL